MPQWHDDLTISDDEWLWRRVLVDDPSHVQRNPVTATPEISSGAFKSRTVLTSVAIASLTTPQDFVAGYPKHSFVAVTARTVRETGCIIVRDPKPDDPAHANIIGTKRADGLLTGAEAKKIANHARWVLYREPEAKKSTGA